MCDCPGYQKWRGKSECIMPWWVCCFCLMKRLCCSFFSWFGEEWPSQLRMCAIIRVQEKRLFKWYSLSKRPSRWYRNNQFARIYPLFDGESVWREDKKRVCLEDSNQVASLNLCWPPPHIGKIPKMQILVRLQGQPTCVCTMLHAVGSKASFVTRGASVFLI